jgi:hypothetical protein
MPTIAAVIIEDAHMTSYMDAGGTPVDTISVVEPIGTWYVSAILRNTQPGTVIRFVWYDTAGNVIDDYTLDPRGESDIYIGGTLELNQVAPEGTYRVELFIDAASEPAATVSFEVKAIGESSTGSATGDFDTYTSRADGYSIDYPADWILLEVQSLNAAAFYPAEYEIAVEGDLNTVICGISADVAAGYTTESILQQWIYETELENYENYTNIDSGIETVNGREMAMFAYSWSRSGYDLYTFDFLVIQGNDLYTITLAATSDVVSTLYPYLEQMVLSFKLL